MSLTLYVCRTKLLVKVVTWFNDEKGFGDFAGGPILDFPSAEFREKGWKFVRDHFIEHESRRLTKGEFIVGSLSRADKNFLANSLAIRVDRDVNGMVELIPCALMKMTLVGNEVLPKETRRQLHFNASEGAFWKAFDEVLEEARKREDPDP
jgi:hypothetical protein